MLRFTATLLAVAVVAQGLAGFSGWLSSPPTISIVVNVVLVLLTVVVYQVVSRAGDQQKFAQAYLLTIVIKILAACILVVVAILADRVHARANVIFLLILYVVYTGIEVSFLLLLRRPFRQ